MQIDSLIVIRRNLGGFPCYYKSIKQESMESAMKGGAIDSNALIMLTLYTIPISVVPFIVSSPITGAQ